MSCLRRKAADVTSDASSLRERLTRTTANGRQLRTPEVLPEKLAELHALPDDSLLTAQEAVAFWRLKYGTLAWYCCQGGGPKVTRVGPKLIRYRAQQIDVMLEAIQSEQETVMSQSSKRRLVGAVAAMLVSMPAGAQSYRAGMRWSSSRTRSRRTGSRV